VLISETAPIDPTELVRQAEAQMYCPSYQFLDREQVKRVQGAGYRVLPWTVNDPEHWERLLEWGVDGITTDFPDRLAARLERC
jgi:glycerophosphoryl diester phosphodiesterase